MRNRRTTNGNKTFSDCMRQMENIIAVLTLERPIERIRSLEQKIDAVDKIAAIESCVKHLKDRIWAVKEILTTAEASAYLGLSESYIYKLTSSKQIPHYKPNGKLVYFNRQELCDWAMKNQVRTAEPTACPENETV
ncbi:DNA binding domain, excisionase family [Alistipes sp. cv1]|uniref:helix-turn-helix domain-containing protein n=1 Tax=Alistipes indistinctus TaxID=626932 RepID=UPI0006C247EA|nr:DNA binding domain, excisionase family [Faecalibacterium prausnitzii]